MSTVALAITCKTPMSGASKTRLSPPLRPDECAAISACFIRDLARTIAALAENGGVTGYALYTPRGSEASLLSLLPDGFKLMPQVEGGFGERLLHGAIDLLAAGHSGAILINSDSPTLPGSILREAAEAVRRGDNVVFSPAYDGGYTLIGVSKPHARLFADIPWSTSDVYRLTLERAREIGLPVVDGAWLVRRRRCRFTTACSRPSLPASGRPSPRSPGAEAPATRAFMRARAAAA